MENKINLTFENVCRKSVDLILDIPFDEDMYIELKNINSLDLNINHSLVFKSTEESEEKFLKTRVILLDDSNLLKEDEEYLVTLYKDDEVLGDKKFKVLTKDYIKNADVSGIGTRIIKISFNEPIENLDYLYKLREYEKQLENIKEEALLNFYISFFKDKNLIDLENDSLNIYSGHIISNITISDSENIKSIKPFNVDVSDDLKTIIITSNYKNLPEGENHNLIINSFALIDYKDNQLKDYSHYRLDYPLTIKEFSLEKFKNKTKVKDIEIISLYEIIVTYDNEVLILEDENFNILCNGIKKELDKNKPLEYADNSLKKVRFYLDKSTPLLRGENIKVTLTSITDASGFKTLESDFLKDIIPVIPKLEIAKEIKDTEYKNIKDLLLENKTIIYLKYSEDMDVPSAIDTNNYKLINELDKKEIPIVIDSIYNFNKTYKKYDEYYMVLNNLEFGDYILNIKDVKDLSYVSIEETNKSIKVTDRKIPECSRVLLSEDELMDFKILLFEFNDNMEAREIENSILNPSNIKLIGKGSEAFKSLVLDEAKVELINNKDIAIVSIKNSFLKDFKLDYDTFDILLGYTRLKDIKYITNSAGNIYPLYETLNIESIVTPIEIESSDSLIEIVEDKKLVFSTGDLNKRFYKETVDLDYIKIKLDDETIYPESFRVLESLSKIEFNFKNESFNSLTKNISIEFIKNSKIKDIFKRDISFGICKNVINNLRGLVISASKIKEDKEDSNSLIIALKYSEDIVYVDKKDFLVETLEGIRCDVLSASIVSSNIIELKIKSNIIKNLESEKLFISTFDENISKLKTRESGGDLLKSFKRLEVKEFNIKSFNWVTINNNNNLNDSLFSIEFSKDIDFEKISLNSANTIFKGTIIKEGFLYIIKINSDLEPLGEIRILAKGEILDESYLNKDLKGEIIIKDKNKLQLKIIDDSINFKEGFLENIIHGYFKPEDYFILSKGDYVYLREDSSNYIYPNK
ncbi:MAG: hypothetical protein ACRC1T_07825 [Clostridium chrysemydis]|uniref:hypothetical protein n=1 Tax=Clostridium chrysemydis TaxID=2665504 RepID=UPI003F3E4A4D